MITLVHHERSDKAHQDISSGCNLYEAVLIILETGHRQRTF
jgi:hypothetical protein